MSTTAALSNSSTGSNRCSWLARCSGTATIVRFNWPKYAAVLGLAGLAAALQASDAPVGVTSAVALGAAMGLIGTVTSLGATWWVYDHRSVYRCVPASLGDTGRWVSVHAGFDDATAVLATCLDRPPIAVVDLGVDARASLRRAQAVQRGHGGGGSSGPGGRLPLATACVDTVFVTLAVHEVRDLAAQRVLFAELRRVLVPGGRLVVTEHLRDVANALVYGPAALHFQPAVTWRARASEVDLRPVGEERITPFVRRFVWRS